MKDAKKRREFAKVECSSLLEITRACLRVVSNAQDRIGRDERPLIHAARLDEIQQRLSTRARNDAESDEKRKICSKIAIEQERD